MEVGQLYALLGQMGQFSNYVKIWANRTLYVAWLITPSLPVRLYQGDYVGKWANRSILFYFGKWASRSIYVGKWVSYTFNVGKEVKWSIYVRKCASRALWFLPVLGQLSTLDSMILEMGIKLPRLYPSTCWHA